MTIALIGTGRTADRIAHRMRAAGHEPIVFAPAGAEAPSGAPGSIEEAIRPAGRVVLASELAGETEDWLTQDSVTRLLAGRHLIDAGRHAPQEVRALAGQVTTAGGRYLEVALQETIAGERLLVGGREEDYHSEIGILSALGRPEYLGPVGQVATVRLALAQLGATMTGALAMSLGLVVREGVDPDRFLALLACTPVHALQFDRQAPRMLAARHDRDGGPDIAELLLDLRAFTRSAVRHHLDTHQLVGLQHIVELAQELGRSEEDSSALHATLCAEAPGHA